MIRETVNALLACVVTLVLCAVAYPAVVYGIGQLLFPRQAAGSLIVRDGKIVGSELIGQPFASDRYFHPRPSAAGANGYDAAAASGSNLGTKNPALRERIVTSLKEWKATPDNPVPADLITASGSGLDPDISPEAAHYQESSVAAARKLPVGRVRALIDAHVVTAGAIIGAPPRVNVLSLNLALDEEKPAVDPTPTPAAEVKPATAAPHPDPAGEVAALTAQVKALSVRLARLQERAGAITQPEDPAARNDLEEKVHKLVERTSDLEGRVGEKEQALQALRSDVEAVRASLTAAPAPTAAGTRSVPAPARSARP